MDIRDWVDMVIAAIGTIAIPLGISNRAAKEDLRKETFQVLSKLDTRATVIETENRINDKDLSELKKQVGDQLTTQVVHGQAIASIQQANLSLTSELRTISTKLEMIPAIKTTVDAIQLSTTGFVPRQEIDRTVDNIQRQIDELKQ